MMAEEKIPPIMVGTAMNSLRNSDFDVQSAICEVIDNSLQADAKEIKIKISYPEKSSERKNMPTSIAFGDDGSGMIPDTLQLCLKLGYSGRYDDRKGIGRFGVGMTFGAISQCQKIEVYSRPKQGNWFYTHLDISNISKDDEPGIIPIEQKQLPEEFKDLVGDCGTLVIWSKIDRMETKIKEDELRHNLGRIYRKFIGQEIIENEKIIKNTNQRNIYINNEIVHAHDPLYATKSTKFPDDETTTINSEISFPWGVHDVDAPTSGQKQGMITIRVSLLPESWRRIRAKIPKSGGGRSISGRSGSGRSKDNIRRNVDKNEGISILRSGREVSYKRYFKVGKSSPELDRFWSCEIDFDPVLDHWFSVRNIKIGARPLTDLKVELEKRIKPSVEHFREKIKKTMDEYDRDQNISNTGPLRAHNDKEEELNASSTPLTNTNVTDQQLKNSQKSATEAFPDDPEKQKEYVDKTTNLQNRYNIIEITNARSTNPFFEIVPDLATKVMHYNLNHEFFLNLKETIAELGKQIQRNDIDKNHLNDLHSILTGYFDNLLYAYSEACYDIDNREREEKVKDTLDELMFKWSFYLNKIYKHL